MAEIKDYILVRATQKRGKIDTTLESKSEAMLRLWALQNTPPTKMCVIAEKETNLIVTKVIGNEHCPKVMKNLQSEEEYLELA